MSLRIALLADPHYADKDPAQGRAYRDALPRLERAVARCNAERIDFLICLGDLIDGPDPAALARVAPILAACRAPRHFVLGNHDLEAHSKPVFLARLGQPASFYSFDRAGWHLVILDGCFRADGVSYDAGPFTWSDAAISPAQFEWLRADLAAATTPTVLFVHQRLDAPEGDPHGLANRTEIRQLLESSGRVKQVIQGHYHRGARQTLNGIDYLTLPALVETPAEYEWPVLELSQGGGPPTATVRIEKAPESTSIGKSTDPVT